MDTSPLITAIHSGDTHAAMTLLANATTVSCRGPQGETPAQLAAYYGQAELAREILKRMPSIDLHSASAAGSVEQVSDSLIGADVEAMSQDGFTALCLASAFNEEAAVRALLAAGANPNARSKSLGQVTPLHAAVFGRKSANVATLLEAGAEANLPQQDGFTALHGAAQNGDVASVELLLGAGADRAARTGAGKSAADLAREAGHQALASRLAQA